MLDFNTVSKLREMKLGAMATAFSGQLGDNAFYELSFEERVGLMVDAEWTSRQNNRMSRLIRNAGFAIPGARLEDVEYHPDRELNKALITRLGTCNFVDDHHNIIIMGATGGGKTYLANAFGVAAVNKFYSVRYVRLPDLLGDLAIARAEGRYRKVIKGYKQANLLILDEWLLYPLKDTEARDLLEIAEARYKKASTIFCSTAARRSERRSCATVSPKNCWTAVKTSFISHPQSYSGWWRSFALTGTRRTRRRIISRWCFNPTC